MLAKQAKELAAKSDDLNLHDGRRELTSGCPWTYTYALWHPYFHIPTHIHTINELKHNRSQEFQKKPGQQPDIL